MEIMARQTVRISALSRALYRQEMYFPSQKKIPKEQPASQPASQLPLPKRLASQKLPAPQPRGRDQTPLLAPKQRKLKSKERFSRKHNRLPIHRPPIRPNPLPTKNALDINPPRLIKPDPPPLHNHIDVPLRVLVQPSPAIAGLDVLRQVKIAAVQAGFGVALPGRRQAGVADARVGVRQRVVQVVEPGWDGTRGGEVGDWWGVGFPEGAG